MFTPVETFIAWRYTRAQRRTQSVSLIAAISISGVALGIAALLTILSIMNGFGREMRERLLGMTAHVEVEAVAGTIPDWAALGAQLAAQRGVVGWAPLIEGQALLTRQNAVQGAQVRGIDPALEAAVSALPRHLRAGSLDALEAGRFRILIGAGIADALGLAVGDGVMLVLAEPLRTASGMLPRLKRFEVAGIFEAGVQEFDTATVFINLHDAQRVFRRQEGVDALRVLAKDPFELDALLAGMPVNHAGKTLKCTSWTERHVNLFRALETEKIVMFVILLLSVGVAAFNLVSTLVMVVTEKTAEIAILQTLGLTPRRVLRVFFTQGALIGSAGVVVGTVVGVILGTRIEAIIAWLEATLGFKILAPDVYYISHIPARLEPVDVMVTLCFSLILCLLAPLYPAWLASRTRPAVELRHE
ncbi:MAG: hypothetical protein RL434_141 [Pseudomonadota bacterium]|jgi:lipoprotein-releasing system permease protein